MTDLLRTVLEFLAVVLLSIGLGLIVASLVGGLLGAGLGVVVTGLVSLGAAELARLAQRPVKESETTT